MFWLCNAEARKTRRAQVKIKDVAAEVVAAAIKVHRHFGPGLSDQVYKTCLFRELEKRSLLVAKEVGLPALTKGELLD